MKKFFGGVEPHCEYCAHGKLSLDKKSVLCKMRGVVAPGYSCLKYSYDPLLREPKCAAPMMDFSVEDFKL